MRCNRVRRAFNSPNLVAAAVCLIILLVLAFILLSNPRPRSARSLKDKTQIKQIHAAMIIFAGGHDGRLPTPGLYGGIDSERPEFMHGAKVHDRSLNHSAPLYSSMISMLYFGPDLLFSPREINSTVTEAVDFNYDAYRPGQGIYWDPAFTANVGDSTIGSNVSYVHLSLCGDRWLKHWLADAPPATPMLGNRGTKNGEYDTENYHRSPTLEFHGPLNQWVGNIVFADNHTETVATFFPSQVRYRFEGDDFDRPDNIYAAEYAHPDGPKAAADAWLSLSIGSSEVAVEEVFDSLRR